VLLRWAEVHRIERKKRSSKRSIAVNYWGNIKGMDERRLSKLFRALVISLSAPAGGAAWVACSTTPDMPDGGEDSSIPDAKSDVPDMGISPFPDGTYLDSYVDWCEAGPPQILGNDGCYAYFYVPCGLPVGDYLLDDAGTINRCDQICKNVNAHDCEIMTDAAVGILFDSGLVPDGALADEDAGEAGGDASAIFVVCGCYNGGRRPAGLCAPRGRRGHPPLARYFSDMAHLEAASVPAFARMRSELAAARAPATLLARIEHAMRDEQRHARTIGRLARRFGGEPPAVRLRRMRARGLGATARENAVEGCVRETYGALVATWQAAHAADPEVRRVMRVIARDETRHAALSWAVATFLEDKLDSRAARRLDRARTRAIASLHDELSRPPHPDLVDQAGLPRADEARRLLCEMTRALGLEPTCST
jgi:hypothetical protein